MHRKRHLARIIAWGLRPQWLRRRLQSQCPDRSHPQAGVRRSAVRSFRTGALLRAGGNHRKQAGQRHSRQYIRFRPPEFRVGGTTRCGAWVAPGGTTTSGSNVAITGPGVGTPCGKKAETIAETGMVVSGTGPAAALVGDSRPATVCYQTSAGTIKNAKGTTITY